MYIKKQNLKKKHFQQYGTTTIIQGLTFIFTCLKVHNLRGVCRDLLYSSALDYFTVNSLNDNMHHASSRTVEQAVILKLT